MATIRKRNGKYQVQIRNLGSNPITKTFTSKSLAEKWARKVQSEIEQGIYKDIRLAQSISFEIASQRYIQDVLPKKKSYKKDISKFGIINKVIGHYLLSQITSEIVASYRDQRLKLVADATVRRELSQISQVLTVAQKEWGISLPQGNPVYQITIPKQGKHRNRRIEHDELEIIMGSISNQGMRIFIELLIETAMRRGELGSLELADIDLENRVIKVTETKTGYDRDIPLSVRAVELFRLLGGCSPLFDFQASSVTQAFMRACRRHRIEGLRLHDLRREGTSRLFEKGLSPAEVQTITGHRTLSMLSVYTKLKAIDLVSKVA